MKERLRSPLAGILAAALLGFLAFVVLRTWPERPVAIPLRVEEGGESMAEAVLVPTPHDSTREERQALDAEPRTIEADADEAGLTDDETARVLVRVVDEVSGQPVTGQRLHASPLENLEGWTSRSIKGSVGSLSEGPRTDEDGEATFVLAAGSYKVVCPIRSGGGTGARDGTEVRDLQAGEIREITIRIPASPDSGFVLRILDAEARQPIPGARADIDTPHAMSLPNDATRELAEGWSELRSDLDGFMEGSAPSSFGATFLIQAEGYTSQTIPWSSMHPTRDRAATVLLFRNAQLRVQILDENGSPLTQAELRLHPDYGRDLILRKNKYPSYVAHSDGSGVATFTDLPPGKELLPAIWKDQVPRTGFAEPLILATGEARETTWDLRGCRIEGQVIDVKGQPVARTRVGLEPAPLREANVPRMGIWNTVATTPTDEEGHFKFDGVPAGDWYVGVLPEDWYRTNTQLPATAISLGGAEANVQVTLRSSKDGGLLQGTVRHENGEPFPHAHVSASGPSMAWAMTEADGTFEMGPLLPGEYELECDGSPTVVVSPGTEDIELVVAARGSVTAIVSCQGSHRGSAILMGASSEGQHTSSCPVDANGKVRFERVVPGIYSLTIHLNDGRRAFVDSIVVGEADVGPLVLEPSEGAHVRILIGDGELIRSSWRASVDGSPVYSSWSQGRQETITVPPGTCTIEVLRAPNSVDPRVPAHTFDLEAGDYREVILETKQQ